jgi:hypothetical protein
MCTTGVCHFCRFSAIFSNAFTDGTIQDSIDFGHHPNLQTLFLMARFQRGTASYLTYALSQLVAPKLQHITLSFWFPSYDCARSEQAWTDLAQIDSILGGGHAFDSLRTVTISFRPRSSSSHEPAIADAEFVQDPVGTVLASAHAANVDQIRQKFVNHFPVLISKGILQVRRGDHV